MDRYKKTSMKMDKNLGYGRNLRAVEINTSRAVARNSRFSMQRCLEDEVENSENKPKTKIATLGKQVKAPATRLEMLQKWKEEKQMRLQRELQNKRPTFKIGVSVPRGTPVLTPGNRADSKPSSMKDSRKISYNVSNSSVSKTKDTSLKPPSTSKFQALPSSSMKFSKNKEPQIPSFSFKPATQFSNSKVQKESYVQAPNKPKTGLQKPLFGISRPIKNEVARQAPAGKSHSNSMPNKPFIAKSKEACQAPALKSQFNPVPNKPFIAKSKIQPLSTLLKPTESKILKKPQFQAQQSTSMPRPAPNRIPEPKSNQMQNSGKIIRGPSKITALTKPTGLPNKSGSKPKQETKPAVKIEEPSESNISFECEISHIACEPTNQRKSFAPSNFSFSFAEDGPFAIYTKLKAGGERTSTPKRKELQECQEKEAQELQEKEALKEKEAQQIKEKEALKETEAQQIKEKEAQEVKEIEVQEKEAEKYLAESGLEIAPSETESEFKVVPSENVKHLIENDISSIAPESNINGSFKTCEIRSDDIKNSFEDKTNKENSTSENSVANIPETLPVINKESQISPLVPALASSEKSIENLMDVFYSPEVSKRKAIEENVNGSVDMPDPLENKVALEKPAAQVSASILEGEKSLFEETKVLLMAGTSSDSVKQKKATLFDGDSGIISRRISAARSSNISVRGNRRSEMPPLESISESRENSLLNESPLQPLPTIKKSTLLKDFTPRRSLRLARRSEFDTPEDLFNVRPSLHATPTDEAGSSSAYNTNTITYDFDQLDLESSKEQPAIPQRRISTRNKNKVSLLYTPPTGSRASSIRKSIKGDLMAFSPDV